MERSELERICSTLGVPGDFDIAQLTWRQDYDPFFYDQLRRRARRMFLFRNEYIFEFERAVVVEVPELGHATYLFARPRTLDDFLSRYARTTKENIRKNRDNVAEALGFVGRVIHGSNPRLWLKEIRVRAGEPVDDAQALA